jgi:hypothetical protein
MHGNSQNLLILLCQFTAEPLFLNGLFTTVRRVQETQAWGNIFRGWSGYTSSKQVLQSVILLQEFKWDYIYYTVS